MQEKQNRGSDLGVLAPHIVNVLNALDACAYVKDGSLGYVWLNDAHCAVLGLKDTSGAQGRKDSDFFPAGAAALIEQKEKDVMKTGKPSKETMKAVQCPDGSKRSFIMNITPVPADGGNVFLLGLWTDITVLDEDLGREKERGAFFEDLFRGATALTAVTDRNGFIIAVNRKGRDLFIGEGADEGAAKGRNILEFIHDDDRASVLKLWKESLAEKKEVNYQLRMKAPDGRIVYLLITGMPFVKDGKVVMFQYQALDMIDQKVREQNLMHSESLETVGQLAGGFAHDFNNLLTVINGYSEMMLNSIDHAHPFYSKIYQICQAGSQASMLTQKILEFSRKTRPEHRLVDINQELSNQEMILRHVIEGNIQLAIEKKEGLQKVMIDPTQFSKMLLNLVINAKDAMPKGGDLTITTDIQKVDESNSARYDNLGYGHYLMLMVSDTGTGMTEEIKQHIFDPFFSTRETGKGIGLWTVSNIVKSIGGTIIVESIPGVGTTFRILLPFAQEVKAPQIAITNEGAVSAGIEGKTILVVEDDDTVRDLVSEILKQKGHTILTARNGGDALQLARQYEGRIDLLITDMVMRRIDGIMLAKKMQSILPDIKIMLMSGYGTDVVKEEEIKDIAFLSKPFLPNELVQKVESIFN